MQIFGMLIIFLNYIHLVFHDSITPGIDFS